MGQNIFIKYKAYFGN